MIVGSIWRDSASYIDRALAQFDALRDLGASFVFAENSSTDDTRDRLAAWAQPGDQLIAVHDDCPYWPSVDHPDRWRHIAWVCNHVMDAVDDTDIFVYVESDLAWDVETMKALVAHLDDVDAVSPLNMHRSGRYYDLWGSSIGGRRFRPDPPFHPALTDALGLLPADSVAGCTAMRGDVAARVRFQPEDCYVGLCRDIRSKGFGLWVDPFLQVVHP